MHHIVNEHEWMLPYCIAGVNAGCHGDLTDRRRLQAKDRERIKDKDFEMSLGKEDERSQDKDGERSQCKKGERSHYKVMSGYVIVLRRISD